MPKTTQTILLAGLSAILLSSCDSGGKVFVRELRDTEKELKLVDTSAERFRYRTRQTETTDQSSGGPQLVYDTPDGWTRQPGSAMRDLNFTFGENGEGECYLARLPGAGGGLAPNVNRWRGQMGAESLSDEEIAALPRKPLFGQEAAFITVDGDYSGMGAGEPKKDYRLLGLILTSDAGAVFVKMVGPRDLVAQNEAAFDTFTSSIDVTLQ